jgi:hypothetical protein
MIRFVLILAAAAAMALVGHGAVTAVKESLAAHRQTLEICDTSQISGENCDCRSFR